MSHTNVTIRDSNYDRQDVHVVLLKAELEFWKSRAEYYRLELENIPESIKESGFVDIYYRHKTITLIQQPEEQEEE